MARARQRKTNSSSKSPRKTQAPSFAESVRADVEAKIARARERREAERLATRGGNHIPKEAVRRVPGGVERVRELQRHGFRTTKKGRGYGVVVDGPRDARRRPIKGAKVEVLKGGVVKTSVKQRRDYVYGFTKNEKKAFARNPEAFTAKKLRELRELFPSLARSRKPQVRLQWGAYQATKDFAPNYFTSRYFEKFASHRPAKGKKRPKKIDTLTGLHIVIHVPKKKAHGKTKRKKGK